MTGEILNFLDSCPKMECSGKNGVELNSGWLSYGKCHTPHDELG